METGLSNSCEPKVENHCFTISNHTIFASRCNLFKTLRMLEDALDKSFSLCDFSMPDLCFMACGAEVPAISVDTMYNLLIWRMLKNLCNLKVTDIIVYTCIL